MIGGFFFFFFFSSRRRHTSWNCDWSSDVCSSDLAPLPVRDRRVRELHAVRPRLPARQPDRWWGPDRLLDHRLAGDRGGWPVHAATPEGRRSGDGLPGVVRWGERRVWRAGTRPW